MQERVDFEQQLIGIVSHDLRNPLNVIVLSAAMLLRGAPLDDSVRRSIYIVDAIVRAYHGTVAVRSSEADGTTFTIRWPRDAVAFASPS